MNKLTSRETDYGTLWFSQAQSYDTSFFILLSRNQIEINERQINGSHCYPNFLGFSFQEKIVWGFFGFMEVLFCGVFKSINR